MELDQTIITFICSLTYQLGLIIKKYAEVLLSFIVNFLSYNFFLIFKKNNLKTEKLSVLFPSFILEVRINRSSSSLSSYQQWSSCSS